MPCGYAVNVEIMDDSAEIAHNSHIHIGQRCSVAHISTGLTMKF